MHQFKKYESFVVTLLNCTRNRYAFYVTDYVIFYMCNTLAKTYCHYPLSVISALIKKLIMKICLLYSYHL